MKSVFEFVVFTQGKKDKEGEYKVAPQVLATGMLVCGNAEEAKMKASMRIPEEYQDQLDLVEVVVRPFRG